MSRTIFKNVNLLDGENAMKKSATVIIQNDRIVSANSGATQGVPDDTIIDLRGLTMMPGMVSGHFHAAYRNGGGPDSSAGDASATSLGYLALSNAQTAIRCGFTSVV